MPAHARPPPACRFALATSDDATQPPPPPTALSLSRASPLLCSLPLSRPSATIAAARRSRDHRLLPAPLTCPRTPPRRSRLLHRAKRRRKLWNAAIAVSFSLGPPRSPVTVRPLCCLAELAEAAAALAVSFCVYSPSSLALSPPANADAVEPESLAPPAMSPPWPPLPRAATEHTVMLSAPPGGRSTPPCHLPCALTPNPSTPELVVVVSGHPSSRRLLHQLRASSSSS
nr:proline-rich protein 36-like [Aegilops tauschii subsp. strangulata]